MLADYRQTLAQLRSSYTPEKRQAEASDELPSYYIYRPLSFFITPLFMAMGMSANGVTALSLAISLLLPLVAAFGGAHACAWMCGIALFIQVLDCVDGNIARVQGSSSSVGRMLDGIGTLVFWPMYFIGVGLLAARENTAFFAAHGLEIGLGLAALFLLQRELEDTFDSYFAERVRWTPPAPAALPGLDFNRFGRVLEHGFSFGVLGVLAALSATHVFLVLLASYQALLFLIWLPRYIRALHARTR